MYKLGRLSRLTTSLALVVVFLVALAVTCPGPYNVYAWRSEGGPTMGPWIQFVSTVSSPMGGNMVLTVSGTTVLDNRTWWPTYPTTIPPTEPTGGHCVPVCQNEY